MASETSFICTIQTKLSLQMVQYKASNKKYPGDEKMRGATQLHKHRQGDNESSTVNERYEQDKKQQRGGKKPRLCSDNLELLKEHLNSFKKTHVAACRHCGEKTYMKCMLCDQHVCFKIGKRITSLTCSIDFHNDRLYGLRYKDHMDMFGVQKSSFKKAAQKEIRWNGKYMDELNKEEVQ